MGTTTTLLTESESRLAGTEQVMPVPGSWRAIAWEDRYPLEKCGTDGAEPRSYWWINRASDPCNELSGWASETDARLIAAAPDMLAALKRLIVIYKTDGHAQPCDCPACAGRLAIAKAEGRTP